MAEATNSAENTEEQKQPETKTTEGTQNEGAGQPAKDPYKTVTVEDMQDEETAKKNDLGEQY